MKSKLFQQKRFSYNFKYEYQFSNIPTILYMYEPLWFYKKEDALKLYHHVIKEFMEKTNHDSKWYL